MTEIWQQLSSWINKNSWRQKIDSWDIIQQTPSCFFPHVMGDSLYFLHVIFSRVKSETGASFLF